MQRSSNNRNQQGRRVNAKGTAVENPKRSRPIRRRTKPRVAQETLKKEIEVVKEVEKKIIKEKESMNKQMSALIQQLDRKLNYKALAGQTVAYDLNTNAFAILFQRLLDRYAMTTSLFVNQDGAANKIYPVDFLLYCWMSLLLHLREVGTVTGDMAEMPSFAENISVPVPVASLIQYIGRYQKADMNLSTIFALSPTFFSSLVQNGHFDPALSYPFPHDNEGQLVDSLSAKPFVGEYFAQRDWTPLSVSAWCQTRLMRVSNYFRALNLPTVPLREIPGYAPGPEAYCCRGIDADTGYVYTNRVFTISKPFDSELGTIFSIGRVRIISEGYMSATIAGFATDPRFGYGTFQIENYLASGCVYLLLQQNEFRHGPIKRVYQLYRRNRVNTFAWSSKLIDGNAVQAIFATVWRQIQRQIPGFNDVQGATSSFRQFYALYSIFLLHLHHRIELSSPIANLALRLQGTTAHSISAYYNEGLAEKVALPAALERFISTVGVVLSHGAMVFPRFHSLPNTPQFTWGDPQWQNNLLAFSWRGFYSTPLNTNAYPFSWAGVGLTLPPNIKTQYYILDAAFEPQYLTVTALNPYPVQHPQAFLSEYIAVWASTTSSQVFKEFATTMVSKNSNLDRKFGTVGQMCSRTGGSGFINKIDIFEGGSDLTAVEEKEADKLGSPAPFGKVAVAYLSPAIVTSSMILNGSEALEAIVIPMSVRSLEINGAYSPYMCKMTVTASNLLLEELIDLTTQAGVNNSIVESSNTPSMLISNAGHVIPTKPTDHPDGPSKWEVAVAQTSQKAVPPLVGAAAGIACDFVPIIGELLSPLCAAGASGLVSTLMSRSLSSGQNFAKPIPEDESRAKIQAVRGGIEEMSKLIGASGEVVKKTSETLARVAASQVRGIVTPQMMVAAKDFHQ
jgi:hypothetical protein